MRLKIRNRLKPRRQRYAHICHTSFVTEKAINNYNTTIAVVLGIAVLLLSIIAGLSDGIGTFFAALFLFGLIATGISYVVGGISDVTYDINQEFKSGNILFKNAIKHINPKT